MRFPDPAKNLRIKFQAESGEEIGWIQLTTVTAAPAAPLTGTGSTFLRLDRHAWLVAFLDFPSDKPLVVQSPGRYLVVLQRDHNNEEIIGEFHYALVEPAQLTPERVAAIKSDPHAVKAVRATLGCPACSDEFRVYTALEHDPKLKAEGFKWYADISEHFVCQCGKTRFDVSTYKRNFHALLGQRHHSPSEEANLVPRYEKSAIESWRVEFLSLVNVDPPEESLQKFVENNPVILHQFPAGKLSFKPSILTRFKSDFAVVTRKKN
jgi:hypothetical protein